MSDFQLKFQIKSSLEYLETLCIEIKQNKVIQKTVAF